MIASVFGPRPQARPLFCIRPRLQHFYFAVLCLVALQQMSKEQISAYVTMFAIRQCAGIARASTLNIHKHPQEEATQEEAKHKNQGKRTWPFFSPGSAGYIVQQVWK